MGRFSKIIAFFSILIATGCLASCMKWDYEESYTDFDVEVDGLFIVCEGNFQYGNASLSFYNPANQEIQNEIFFRANGMKLGDVAQSMTIYDDKAWIAVNNSHVIFAIDPNTFKELGRIENLTSPRYVYFINNKKAYVSQIWDNRIFIVDPSNYSISGHIEVPGMSMQSGSTEQMVGYDKFVFCTCWSYQNKIIKIDTETDSVVEELNVGVQPSSLVKDYHNRLWTLTDGGYQNSIYGYEAPALFCIDPESFSVVKYFPFKLGDAPSELVIDGSGENIYWINNDIWSMSVDSDVLPSFPVVEYKNTRFYGLTIDPKNSDIYVADAVDFMQQGMILHYSASGDFINQFYVGVAPGAFCWK